MTYRTIGRCALLAGVLATATGFAQQMPTQPNPAMLHFTAADFAVTYTAERAKLAPSNCGCFWLNGASGDVAASFYKGLGVAANLTLKHASNITPGVNLSQVAFVAGPLHLR